MMARPLVHILVLNFNRCADTVECLFSLQRISYEAAKIVLIDNNSSDGSKEKIREMFPNVTIIQNEANLGFAGGFNRGIKNSILNGAEYLLLLNNDTVVAPEIIDEFLKAITAFPKAGILGAKILYYGQDNKIWSMGARWNPGEVGFNHLGWGELDDGKNWEEVLPVDYVNGCALFFPRELVEKIGMMEEKFFLNWEEIDWCYRARRAGYSCLAVPGAKIWHKISASFSEGFGGPLWSYYMWRNRFLWIERNFRLPQAIGLYMKLFPVFLRQVRCCMNPWKSKENERRARAALRGTWDYFRRRFGKYPRTPDDSRD